ncbi:hypothetical protein V8F33_012616 [Rhypophila sp. PSN 637]
MDVESGMTTSAPSWYMGVLALGHAISAGTAIFGRDDKMVRALEWLKHVAQEIHFGLFVVNE